LGWGLTSFLSNPGLVGKSLNMGLLLDRRNPDSFVPVDRCNPAFCRCSSFHSSREDIRLRISKRFVSSRGRERNCMRKFVMTCLSTVDDGDARFSNRRALVRCSFNITAAKSIL
jgi:hypothetical protein